MAITLIQERPYTFYFDSYNTDGLRLGWEDDPSHMVDGILKTNALTWINNRIQWLDKSTATIQAESSIIRVETRAYSGVAIAGVLCGPLSQYLRPVFTAGQGDTHSFHPTYPPVGGGSSIPNWSQWFDITNDTNAPGTWAWTDIAALDMDTWMVRTICGDPNGCECYRIELRVTCASSCSLNSPEEVSDDHSQNTKMLNLWNGERIVFGLSRNNWTLVLTGSEWYPNACDRIICIRDLGLDDKPVAISGLNNINWDGNWRIRSLGWKIISLKPEHIDWILELERYE